MVELCGRIYLRHLPSSGATLVGSTADGVPTELSSYRVFLGSFGIYFLLLHHHATTITTGRRSCDEDEESHDHQTTIESTRMMSAVDLRLVTNTAVCLRIL